MTRRLLHLAAAAALALIAWAVLGLFAAPSAQAQSDYACSAAYRIDETLPTGARWEMCWEPRALEGVVLHDITFTPPGGTRRLILATASLAQVHVPYDDNGARFHDVTDYGFGGNYQAALKPEECPDGLILNHNGKSILCKQIQVRGLAQRYYDRTLNGYNLSLFSVSTSGDYNYITQWVFQDDGAIVPTVGAAGQLQRYGSDPQYGWITGPIPISHFHNYWWRLDFDIDGLANDLVEEIQFNQTDSGRRYTVAVRPLTVETAAVHNPQLMRSWRVRDTVVKNSENRPISYQIEGLSSGHDFIGPDFEPFSQSDLYVTRAHVCERFPSHNPTLNGCGDDVTDFVNGEDVNGQDVVVWYGVTFHHLPRSEDETWMNVHWDGFTIVPRDFTASNPLDGRTNSGAAPSTATPTATPTVAAPPPTATPITVPAMGCTNLLANGGFENGAAWAVGSTSYPAAYAQQPLRSGVRSMRAGLPAAVANKLSYSSFFQRVVVPAAAQQVYIEWWEKPGGAGDGVDMREALLLDNGFGLLRTFERTTAGGDDQWHLRRFDLTAQRGQTVIAYFNVYNNGGGERLWNSYDDVALMACSTSPLPAPQPLALAAAPGQFVLDASALPKTVDVAVTSPAGGNVAWDSSVDVPWIAVAPADGGGTPGTLKLIIGAPPGDAAISTGNVLLAGVSDPAAAAAVQVVVLRGMDERQYLPTIQGGEE